MHSTRTSTALFVQSQGVTANNHFDNFFVIIAFRRRTQNLFDYSTVNISGPPEFTNIVCSN